MYTSRSTYIYTTCLGGFDIFRARRTWKRCARVVKQNANRDDIECKFCLFSSGIRFRPCISDNDKYTHAHICIISYTYTHINKYYMFY